MIIGIKDGVKLVGIIIVCFCAAFVCTFFLNFYVDALAIADSVPAAAQPLYDAQLATAKLVCVITGGFLGVIALVMLVFYIKLFIDGNAKRFGLLKAMGYSDLKISLAFWVFGLAVFVGALSGCCAGYAIMPVIYGGMTIDGLEITIGFHAWLPFALVLAPTACFGAFACGYARLFLRRNTVAMLKGGSKPAHVKKVSCGGAVPFLTEMRRGVLRSKKSAVFFVTFSCFCFSAMVQMGSSMRTLSSVTMGMIIFTIGVVLSAVAMIMAVTTVVTGNVRNISLMRAFGYSQKERATAVLAGYIPFAFIGFAAGTVYQYGLLRIMVDVVFADIVGMPEYSFDVSIFFATLAVFVVAYTLTMLYYVRKINKVSVRSAMLEE